MSLPPPLDDALMKGYDPNVTRRLAAFTKPYRWPLLLAVLLMLVTSSMAVAGPYLVKVALDSGLRGHSLAALGNAVTLYLLAAGVQWAANYSGRQPESCPHRFGLPLGD